VAIAAENKATPREQWREYLRMQERMRSCVREIRRQRAHSGNRHPVWFEALRLLKQPIPTAESLQRGEAQQLCGRLSSILEILENPPETATEG